MRRTAVGIVIAVVLLAGLVGVVFGPAAGQTAGNETTVDCTYPIEVTDANGATVTVGEEPQRVVTLAPSASQVMWEIGAQEKVVGMPVNPYTSYLHGSSEKTNVVNEQGQPQIESILNQEPDLVLAPNIISDDAVEQLRNADVTVYRFAQASSIADVVEKTRLTGRLVGECDTGREVSARTEATLETYRGATADKEQPTVYYAMGGGYTAGQQTFIGDVIDAAGGENIAAAANISTYGEINTEVVRNQNPDWIVVPAGRTVPSEPAINETTAVQEDQILRVDNNFISQPGPRVTQPLETMVEAFHPDALTTETTTAQSVTLQSNQTFGTTTRTTTTSGPGFGIVASLLALVGAGAIARRR